MATTMFPKDVYRFLLKLVGKKNIPRMLILSWSKGNKKVIISLPETNIAPENRPSQEERKVPVPTIHTGYVTFREGKLK